ncbi:MAG: SPOR domain-containing protein [Deltaproteobacteria bacterium]|nr:MAG: SPOR domain-containing protein [Deltaproteobacteria bacterium]
MSAAKQDKPGKKLVRFKMSRLALAGWCLGLLLALLWMFLLGLFVGKGITPANINLAEIRKRMIAEGIWPGSGKAPQEEKISGSQKEPAKIPVEDLEFYEELAQNKSAPSESHPNVTMPSQESPNVSVAPLSRSPQGRDTFASKQGKPNPYLFTVQIASFKDLASAKKFAASLKDLKNQATTRQADLPGKGRWYRVQVGQYPSRAEAATLAQRLSEQYRLQAFVVRLDGAE